VTVAVIDSRIDTRQPDLVGQIATMADFTDTPRGPPELHGTAVAGVIAARENNGVGIVGIAPSARLLGLRACVEKSATVTMCNGLSLAKALQYAITRNARIINPSLSGPEDRLLTRLIALAVERGDTVVAAVDPAEADGGFPASLPGVVAVAAHSLARLPPGVYTAPGQGVPTTAPGNK
jgi:subtilisin family serine protease